MTGLSSLSLARSAKKTIPAGARAYSGSHCEWIDMNSVKSEGVGCANGYKFVIKPQSGPERLRVQLSDCYVQMFSPGNRRQLLFVDGKTILAFVARGSKFADCSSYTEVTSQVDCKANANLETVSLPTSCSGGSGSSTGKTLTPTSHPSLYAALKNILTKS